MGLFESAGGREPMPELLENSALIDQAASRLPAGVGVPPTTGAGRARVREDVEWRARNDLRRQIAALERELAELFATAFPRGGFEWGVAAAGGPRVLGVGDLERVRDALALRVKETQRELSARAEIEESNRELLERMIAEPEEHRWVRVSNEDIGEPGCRHWHARPRWGLLGMILGWWRIRLSSGCP